MTLAGSCSSKEEVNEILAKRRILQTGNQTAGNFTNCTIPNCRTCAGSVCGTCATNFQLTSTGQCMSCNVANCLSCSSADVCQNCNTANLKPSPNGRACFSCNTQLPNMAGCLQCNGTDTCGLCANGLQLFSISTASSVCINCSISNCLGCGINPNNMTQSICTRCAAGYSISPNGGACLQCLFPCNTCTANVGPNNCATCAIPEFFPTALANGTCLRNMITGCLSPNPSNSSLCGACHPGFILALNGTRCNWTCIENCNTCNNNATCTNCAVGFFVNGNGTCSVCPMRGCQACSASGSTPTCTQCLKGFYALAGECKACPGFCLDCSSSTTCNELAETNNQVLLMIDGKAVLAVCESTCVACSNSNPEVCLECTEGFFLDLGKCKKCAGNCKSCSSANRT